MNTIHTNTDGNNDENDNSDYIIVITKIIKY